MREIVINVGCDDCGGRWAEAEADVAESIPVTFDGTALEVDLCPKCREKKRKEFAQLFACARSPIKRGNVRKKTRRPAASKAELTCRCGYVAKTVAGLGVHKRRAKQHRSRRKTS